MDDIESHETKHQEYDALTLLGLWVVRNIYRWRKVMNIWSGFLMFLFFLRLSLFVLFNYFNYTQMEHHIVPILDWAVTPLFFFAILVLNLFMTRFDVPITSGENRYLRSGGNVWTFNKQMVDNFGLGYNSFFMILYTIVLLLWWVWAILQVYMYSAASYYCGNANGLIFGVRHDFTTCLLRSGVAVAKISSPANHLYIWSAVLIGVFYVLIKFFIVVYSLFLLVTKWCTPMEKWFMKGWFNEIKGKELRNLIVSSRYRHQFDSLNVTGKKRKYSAMTDTDDDM